MKKWLFLGIAVVLVVLVLVALPYLKTYKSALTESPSSTASLTSQEITSPWIEVVQPSAFLVNSDGTTKELQTGDQINQGDKIKTDENGTANIYFPDGSVARLNTSTEITVESASYDEPNQSLVVKIFVSAGKVWSKIMDLATPNSSWQVESSNAVATVRGTAFAVQVADDNTEVIGSEHDVTVKIKDANNNLLADEAVVGPDKYLKIDKNFVDGVVGKRMIMRTAVKDAVAAVKNQAWIQKAKASDAQTLDLINAMKINVKSIEGRKTIREMMQLMILKDKVNFAGLANLRELLLQRQAEILQKLNQLKSLQPSLQLPASVLQQLNNIESVLPEAPTTTSLTPTLRTVVSPVLTTKVLSPTAPTTNLR